MPLAANATNTIYTLSVLRSGRCATDDDFGETGGGGGGTDVAETFCCAAAAIAIIISRSCSNFGYCGRVLGIVY